MYIKEYLEQFKDKKVKLYVDMDGVIADYIFGEAKDYDIKRPLFDSIRKLEEVSKMSNVEMFIFSATRYSEGLEQKHGWLDKYAPFFKKENRILISREENGMTETAILKAEYMKNIERDGSVMILIDDDPRNLKEIRKQNEDVLLLKDTALID
jgi:5'(3')-deoxyribonucleotidase